MYIFTDADKKIPSSIFRTHLNYIKCVDSLLDDFTLKVSIRTNGVLTDDKLKKFETLARITQQSIDSEVGAISQQSEYSQVVAPWIPVKCYNRLYYLEAIFLFLLNGDRSVFKHGGHTAVRRNMQKYLQSKAVIGSSAELSAVVKLSDALSHKAAVGSNIRHNYYSTDECIKSVRRKIAEYKELGWKEANSIKDFLKDAVRIKRTVFRQKESIVLLDYFYWMRIKANYRDVDFLDFDNEISADDAIEYIRHYVSATYKYASALMRAIKVLRAKRGL